jgi:16S rRNA (guanine1516-N2)-methyltransferase
MYSPTITIAITSTAEKYHERACQLAAELKLPLFQEANVKKIDYLLTVGEKLAVVPFTTRLSPRGKGFSIDFFSGRLQYRKASIGKNQLIAKAVGLKKQGLPLRVLDATAGCGQDAFILASLGCDVVMLERSPIIYALLNDALVRAKASGLVEADHLTLIQCESIAYLQSLASQPRGTHPDVIYLDPMYGGSRQTLPNKFAFILREIVGRDEDAMALLKAALACYPRRVVLKQPRSGKTVFGTKASLQLVGKSIRFDVFFPRLI